MFRIVILLAGIGIGFAVAKVLLPAKGTDTSGGAASCEPTVACAAPSALPTSSDHVAMSSAAAKPTESSTEAEPIPRVTVTIPSRDFSSDTAAVDPAAASGPAGDLLGKLGIRKGDVILRVNNRVVYSPIEAFELINALSQANAPVKEVLVRRAGQELRLRPRS